MSASVASPETLLNRILSLKESTPFLLSLDTINQSHHAFTDEFVHHIRSFAPSLPITYISFETPLKSKPSYLTPSDSFVSFYSKSKNDQLMYITKLSQQTSKNLIIIDSFNSLNQNEIVTFLKSLINLNNIVYGIYHLDIPASATSKTLPSSLTYLKFLCSVIFEIKPLNFDESQYLSHLESPEVFPSSISLPSFHLDLTYRRKSGRELKYKFTIDSNNHNIKLIVEQVEQNEEDESLLKDLTTFNLTTNDKQKKQREQVDLPFMEAQKSLGSVGSAIVYTFEKDDDYDEEDPYEDPF